MPRTFILAVNVLSRPYQLKADGILKYERFRIDPDLKTTSGFNEDFRIPPNAETHPAEARSHPPIGGSLLQGMMPHMHLRVKSFRYTARFPDGKEEILVDVPRYDFNWR